MNQIKAFPDALAMGQAAAQFVAGKLTSFILKNGQANLILATGASQFTFLEALKQRDEIDWSKITVFHLDEYIGISKTHPASFRKYLKERILDEVKPKTVHYINGDAIPLEIEISRYESLLKACEIDIACIGIGENGHLAFNDPPVADFEDRALIKSVKLDQACRQQQVGEEWFSSLQEVPTHALSLTIPAILRSKIISCVVPDERKAEAVKNTIDGPISTRCPASILRTHPDCTLFIDLAAAKLL